MFDPLRRLKVLPWIQLLQAALITVLIAIALDIAILTLLMVPLLQRLAAQVLYSPLGSLIELACAVGIGALSVVVLERWFRQVMITSASLWALVPCVGLWLGLKMLLPIPTLLVPSLSYITLVCVILGVFWKGRPYWRWR